VRFATLDGTRTLTALLLFLASYGSPREALGTVTPLPPAEPAVCEDQLTSSLECAITNGATGLVPWTAADAAPQGLRVQGNQIVYQGRAVRLRGVALGEVWDYARMHRDARRDLRAMAERWNANVVRLGVHPSTWRDHRDEALRDLLAQVGAARDAGLFVIVDYHVIGAPDGYYPQSDPRWGTPVDLYDSSFALAVDFWDTISRRLHDDRVMFELWNEPTFAAHETNPHDTATSRWRDLKPYFERLVTTIRGNGATSIVIASGNHWAYNLKGIRTDLLADPNSAYSWHVYSNKEFNDPERWAAALDGLDTVKPVVVTEWGFEPTSVEHWRGTADGFGEPFRRLLEAHGLHSTAWCWNANYGPALLEKDWTTPTVLGSFVQAYLHETVEGTARPLVARSQEPRPARELVRSAPRRHDVAVAANGQSIHQPALVAYHSRRAAALIARR
jgi:Cellulase (glycosyl hydrolase family 5)